jgi:hypothetical protein
MAEFGLRGWVGRGEFLPDPADLTTDRIASLIDDLITEIREVIARRASGPLAEAPTKAT